MSIISTKKLLISLIVVMGIMILGVIRPVCAVDDIQDMEENILKEICTDSLNSSLDLTWEE